MRLKPLIPLLAILLAATSRAQAQSVVTLQPSADAHLQDINPSSNFGAAPEIWFGRGSFFGLGNVRTLVRFDLSGLPSDPRAIRRATFGAYQHRTEAAAGGLDCELHAATGAWTEAGVTWNNQPTYDARVWDMASVGDSFYVGWIEWDATGLVQEHVGGLANLGWLFRMTFETAGASRLGYFYSREYAADPSKRLRLVVELYDLLLETTPLTAGQPATIGARGATPGGQVFFARSGTGLGSFPVPALGVVLDLDAPAMAGSAMANANGVAVQTVVLPPSTAGRTVWLQACEAGATSNVQSTTIL